MKKAIKPFRLVEVKKEVLVLYFKDAKVER